MFEVNQLIKEKTLDITDDVTIAIYCRMRLGNILVNYNFQVNRQKC